MGKVKFNQKNVLAYLKQQTEPRSASEIRFLLAYGNVFPLAVVTKVLEALERKGEARRLAFGYWEYVRKEQTITEE